MDKLEIINQIGTRISSEVLKQPDKIIDPHESLIMSGLVDSFSLIDLALEVENLFNVRIEDYELNSDTFDNLDQLAQMIQARIEK
jgi:acyl carrier protein